ncbi:hypothetical protein BUALT_Bualt04G0075500 [Buddleja alternifolia]|uniref:RING-type domain-containing protein n=1 Tax=Buddleja alternifolia TaxID=168488 RepID=A0AAV6XP31_9LAMI|nr:hypothetical protein BUALT_Bualt04G0075500 [Buddleja alternifolia]
MENSETSRKSECDCAEQRERIEAENEAIAGGVAVVVGGYNKEKPPEDDCCPICFDDFNLPCKTNCGHWFCCSCILELWRYTTGFKLCKCPLCGCVITKLVPEPFLLNQQGEDVGQVLKDVHQYNCLNRGGLIGLFLKASMLPHLMRRRSRESFDTRMFRYIFETMRLIGLLLRGLYDGYGLHFFPNGGRGIQIMFEICSWALVFILILDGIWYRWRLRRRLAGLPPMER